MKEVIGFIGLGVMGHSMCGHILDAGYEVHVYNRTKSKADSLVERGAIWEDNPAALAGKCTTVITIVGYPKDVEEVYFGKNGIFSGVKAGTLVIDMTTTKPSLAVSIAAKAFDLGCTALDAPVSGGDKGAKEGKLTIMVGGEQKTLDRAMPVLRLMGTNIILEGGAGAGQHTKMCNQIAIAGQMIGMCEALLYAKKAGLDLTTMVNTIKGGAAACWELDNLAPRVINGDYKPGFFIDHFVKDMGIALEESRRMGLCLPGLALVQQLYIAMQGEGHGKMGTQALVIALDKISGSGCFAEE